MNRNEICRVLPHICTAHFAVPQLNSTYQYTMVSIVRGGFSAVYFDVLNANGFYNSQPGTKR
jgi:hypothetical protein